ncbi:DUSAM domain-containing protein [Archangium violaceum]|uniref:DUSAM domain-containing protein n=1 Tax=Archangium violaceum TaxID=83451 RepID=UPI0019500B82|nr:DUSAM domain-containing protein [Archangium violaceum]QRN97588.1 DUSAM domain-containing protein [Archangium violaceum]
MNEETDWEEIRTLAEQLERDQPLERSAAVCDLLRRVARQVALSDDEAARGLLSPSDAATLVGKISRRIRVGSRRLSRAIVDASRRREAGDIQGARKLFEDVLTVEVVPLYREIAQTQLNALGE